MHSQQSMLSTEPHSCVQSESSGVVTTSTCQSCALADVPLPEGLVAPTEENDELRAEADADTGKPEKWTETGLHTAQ